MTFVKVNPYKNLFQNFDQIVNDFLGGHFPEPSKDGFAFKRPLTNIIETADGFRLEIAVPGLSKEDIDIKVDKDVLTISANKEAKQKEGEKVIRHSFSYVNFQRSFNLPETIDIKKIKAGFENGVLLINLAKKEEAKEMPARNIEIA